MQKAAKQNLSLAQTALGAFYMYGFGVKENYQKAYFWLKKSAAQGNSNAQYNLGVFALSIHQFSL